MITYLKKDYDLPECKFRGSRKDIRFPCLVSVKLDGELCYIIRKNDSVCCVNKAKYGRYRFDFPALNRLETLPEGIYLGELHYGEGRNKEDFHNLLRNKSDDNLNIKLFGILDADFERTVEFLNKHKEFAIPFWVCDNWKEIEKLIFEWIIERNYEGLVIRNYNAMWTEGRNKRWIKVKTIDRDHNFRKGVYGIWVDKEKKKIIM